MSLLSATIKTYNREIGSILALAGIILALIASTVLPLFASAAQVTQRSIGLSSSSAAATGVTYNVSFTSVGAAVAFVVDFCSNTPLIGEACTPAAGFSTAAVDTDTAGFAAAPLLSNRAVLVTGTVGTTANISVELEGITNPSAAGPLFARIITYSDADSAALYTATDLGDDTVDDGSVAVSITDTIGVSGAVLETLVFCASSETIAKDCDVEEDSAPTLQLGELSGSVVALSANAVSTGDVYTQISTNAVNGAVVSLKSSAVGCGGLLRAGAPGACNILPAQQLGILAGNARFGVIASAATDSAGADATGAYIPVSGSGYNGSTYALNFDEDEETGVTSTYGDPFLTTNNAPANNKNVTLTFGASISNDTPAGLYSTDISLIATGRY